ncbi:MULTISPECIES: TAXI family TRAP transporter solute-binding subunit [unclassified Paenibacillus]|uniref:TAXI family TRAP transporter solute-binding subunit n=1 Tax=unclassified Paenibacillus TaxID=185978 RepID=UPI001AE1E066|nr:MULTISPECIES: TAXI family TRAP transporter solute-binding subunit [unclassified Paenibacillus]MBP1155590.1 TRAP transporter TAXI family solute receptor [Paenibacillus sp. PvP091]MBP1169024.1 TRAP transporter TAXI family solute receptor [Paenibacillus sp. PvR098]MBP2440052.1 TRAP transporter TAXI family solute receptor [Paenibacillus sp. PvP052]
MVKNKHLKTVSSLLLVLALLIGCSTKPGMTMNEKKTNGGDVPASDSNQPMDLRFMAAAQSGSWYPLAVGITEALKKNMSNIKQISIEPGGGVANVLAVNGGMGQMGFSQAMPTVDGYAGNAPFKEKNENVQYVLSLFPHTTHIAVLKNSGITKIEDMKGKKINVGPRGLLTEDIASRILQAYGMSYKDMASVQNLSFADSVEQMKDGRLDVLFWTVPSPFAVLTDLSQSKEIDLLPIPEEIIKQMTSSNSGLVKVTLPKGTYKGVDYDVVTVQSPLVVIANKNAPEQLVYQMTKTIYDNLENLKNIDPALKPVTKESLLVDIGVPIHPGAKKFFQEKGMLK